MRIFEIRPTQALEYQTLPPWPPAAPGGETGAQRRGSFLWLSITRDELKADLPALQAALQRLCGVSLLALHVSALLNEQLPSHYDYTSAYDLLVMRRLASAEGATVSAEPALRHGPPVLRRIDTRPVGFVVLEGVLLSVHPADGSIRSAMATRLLAANAPSAEPAIDTRTPSARLPSSPADLMLRMLNQIVDGYLALRRDLTRQLDHWQAELIDPKTRFSNWSALMHSRQSLHHLDEICEDQRGAVQDWIDAFEASSVSSAPETARERELLLVRGRDLLEHIQRVVHHVRRLEQNAETAVQLHFSVQSHRTNDIMRVLTVLTAVFLPLNLVAGIFGMNFEFIPLIHKAGGFWIAMGLMAMMALALVAVFWRKRYLTRTAK